MRTICWAVCAIALTCAAAAAPIEVSLSYERYPVPPPGEYNLGFRPYGGQGFYQDTEKAPEGDWKLPKLLSETPRYGLLTLGDRKHLFVMDQKAADDAFYTRAYLDVNANNDLTDDAPIDSTGEEGDSSFYQATFPRVDLDIVVDGKTLPYSFDFYIYGFQEGSQGVMDRIAGLFSKAKKKPLLNVSMGVRVACAYTAKFEAAGRNYTVWLGDGDANGRFNDPMRPYEEAIIDEKTLYLLGDHLYVTDTDKIEFSDAFLLADKLLLSDALFGVKVDVPGGKMTLTPITEGLGTLTFPEAPSKLQVCTDDRKSGLMLFRPGKKAIVPPGDYRLLSYVVKRTDKQGDQWRLNAAGTVDCPLVKVASGKDTELPFGEPFRPIATVGKWERDLIAKGDRTEVRLNLEIEGAGKELVNDLFHTGEKTDIRLAENKLRPKEPTYKVMKADGELVTSGQFEYG
ncbi:MAG: hypothetical protein QG656_1903 [Candidatus Hydrogenedentes bacterium]|nr:hypothetical protein [Candidatus Hydrogenedentota bacterium]